MNVLVACEFSGAVRDAFTACGHNAVSADLLPSETPGQHYEGDVLDVLNEGWDLIIAHPPCTFLSNSGVRWLYDARYPNRWQDLIQGAVFFRKMLHADAPRVAVENPVMHKWAKLIVGRDQTQVVQPWWFGHGEVKATCLWLKNLPPLVPTDVVEGRVARVHSMSEHHPDRQGERSRTLPGLAGAMADQWGSP